MRPNLRCVARRCVVVVGGCRGSGNIVLVLTVCAYLNEFRTVEFAVAPVASYFEHNGEN
jgi:hypothetical protein